MYGEAEMFQTDPHWRDCLLFYEYFHGDNGAGIGASHQTGWTGVVARQIELFHTVTAAEFLAGGRAAAYGKAAAAAAPAPAAASQGAAAPVPTLTFLAPGADRPIVNPPAPAGAATPDVADARAR